MSLRTSRPYAARCGMAPHLDKAGARTPDRTTEVEHAARSIHATTACLGCRYHGNLAMLGLNGYMYVCVAKLVWGHVGVVRTTNVAICSVHS